MKSLIKFIAWFILCLSLSFAQNAEPPSAEKKDSLKIVQNNIAQCTIRIDQTIAKQDSIIILLERIKAERANK